MELMMLSQSIKRIHYLSMLNIVSSKLAYLAYASFITRSSILGSANDKVHYSIYSIYGILLNIIGLCTCEIGVSLSERLILNILDYYIVDIHAYKIAFFGNIMRQRKQQSPTYLPYSVLRSAINYLTPSTSSSTINHNQNG